MINNILIIDNSPGFTGAFKSIRNFTGRLQDHYHFTFALPTNSSLAKQLRHSGYQVTELNFLEISKHFKIIFYLPVLLYNSFKIRRLVKKNNIRIIHVNDLYNMIGILVKLLHPRIKLVYHVRLLPNSYAGKFYNLWRQLIEKYADEIIVVSKVVAANFQKRNPVIIHDSFEPTVQPTPHENKQFTILYLANYIPGKGHRQALKAFKKALPEIQNSKLIFYGGTLGNSKNYKFRKLLIQDTDKLTLTNHIIFNDYLEQPEHQIAQANLILNFSKSESFSMTTLEALAYGTPIVVTDCGGPAEIIENGVTGILVPVNDIDSMAAAIVKLYSDSELRNYFSKNGQIRFHQKFNLEKQASLLNQVYQRLL